MNDSEDTARVAGELADLTRTVNEMESQLETFRPRAERQKSARTSSKAALTSRRGNQPRSVSVSRAAADALRQAT